MVQDLLMGEDAEGDIIKTEMHVFDGFGWLSRTRWGIEQQFSGVESAGHDVPVTIVGDFASFEVGYIGIFELTPDDTASIHLCKIVRRERGDFDTKVVLAFAHVRRDVYLEGCCKDHTGITTVDIDTSGLADITEAKDCLTGFAGQLDGGLISHGADCVGPYIGPVL